MAPKDSRPPVCPKCSGEMAEGFIPDVMDGGYRGPARWIEGAPEPSWLTGVKSAKGAAQYRLTAFRCRQCGFVESYAREAPE